ncbi:helix-turn-helix transcriptional regulator [Variovorax sp. J22P168]|uniref:helix-turn-helix transcriptional regulator n=1 Tax=Variovorax jilinensis TaxID=3053513 RepID=UPI0025779FFE|nr:helix-turn-helix transcriptional regulator [Variovorax sp. J22P168]MDM0012118.1 helix-turn-helix transcriptional regulator [Variovorax sp. J22P168]
MASTWLLDSPPAGHTLDSGAVARLLDAGDGRAPAREMLDFVNHVLPVEYISLVEYVDGVPSQVEGHSTGRHDNITAECFSLYKSRFRQADELTRLATRMAGETAMDAPVTALLYDVEDIPDPGWRDQIFIGRQLTGRVSFLYAPLPRTLFAINLYRDQHDGCFEEADMQRLLGLATILKKAHRNALFAHLASPDPQLRGPDIERALQRTAPLLSVRERAVCARIACGMGTDGIAVDLRIAASTVATLRKRAYAKLAIHGRQQLLRFIH